MQIECNFAQAEDAIMLDKDGFVSETNATNIVSIPSAYLQIDICHMIVVKLPLCLTAVHG